MKVAALLLCIIMVAPSLAAIAATDGALPTTNDEPAGPRAAGDPTTLKLDAHNWNATWSMTDISVYNTVNLTSGSGGGAILDIDKKNFTGGGEVKLTGNQKNKGNPDMAVNTKGNLVAVWDVDNSADGAPDYDIYGNIIDTATGQPGQEFVITNSKRNETRPRVAALSDGDFAVVWIDDGTDTGNAVTIQMAIFNSTGILKTSCKIGADTDNKGNPDIAADGEGKILVVWEDHGNALDFDILGHYYNSSGVGTGGDLKIGATSKDERNPVVTSFDKNMYMVAWQRYNDPTGSEAGWNINGSIVKDASLTPFPIRAAVDEQMNPCIASYPGLPQVAVAWREMPTDKQKGDANISAILVNVSGDVSGNKIDVANITAWDEREPSVAMDSQGNFAVFWSDNRSSGKDYSIYAKMYDSTGHGIAREVVVCNESLSQAEPSSAVTPGGTFWAVFTDARAGSGTDIFARELIHPYFSPGLLTTGDFAPANLYKWEHFNRTLSVQATTKSDLNYSYSVDSGASWNFINDRENLTGVSIASGKIRIRVKFTSFDNESSPWLRDFSVAYMTNRAPLIMSFPANGTVPKNVPYTLATCATDSDGDKIVYNWSLKGTPGATLSNYSAASPVFLATHSGNYTVSLNITDGYVWVKKETNLTVINHEPAISGPDNLYMWKKSSQRLAFSATDSDNDTLSYEWAFGANPGSGASLNNTSCLAPTLNVTLSGVYSLKLVVRDGETERAALLNVTATGRQPSVWGPSSLFVFKKTAALLDFCALDPDDDALAFEWSFLSNPGSGASLNSSSCLSPLFNATMAGNYSLRLVVSDADNSSTAFINVTAVGKPPVAGLTVDRPSVKRGEAVRLDASSSTDPEGDALSYRFTFGDGTVTDWGSASSASITYKAVGTYSARVEVRDIDGNMSASDILTITVLPVGKPGQNMPPVASFTVRPLSVNDTINFTFNSTSYDPDGNITRTVWNFADGSTGVGTSVAHSFMYTGNYSVSITVTDNNGSQSSTSRLVVVYVPGAVTPSNRPPVITVAVPDADPESELGNSSSFGVTVSDPDRDPISYAWTVNGTAQSGATGASFSYKPTKAGTYRISVTVSDGKAASLSHNWTLNVKLPPAPPTPPTPPGPNPNPPSAFDTYAYPSIMIMVILAMVVAAIALIATKRKRTTLADLPPEEEDETVSKPAPGPAQTHRPSSMEMAAPPVSVSAAVVSQPERHSEAYTQPENEYVPRELAEEDEPEAPSAPVTHTESPPRKQRRSLSIVSVTKPAAKAPKEAVAEETAPAEPESATPEEPDAVPAPEPADIDSVTAAESFYSASSQSSEEDRIDAVAAATAPKHRAGPAPKVVATDTEGPGRVEQVFLLYMDGRLISHVSYTGDKKHMDADIFGSMLHAVQSFVKDSFKGPENLSALGFGKKRIMIQRGPQIFLAVVTTGTELPGLKEKMRKVLIAIWDEYREYLKKWNGSTDDLKGLKTILKTAFQ